MKLTKSLSIKYKIISGMIFSFIIFFSAFIICGFIYKEILLEIQKDKIKNIAESISSIIINYEDLEKSGFLKKDEAMTQAKETIKKIRYGNNDYFFIINDEPTVIMHPVKKELEGKNVSNVKDPNGFDYFNAFVRETKNSPNNSAFVDYMFAKPGEIKPVQKVSYVKYFPQWKWILGTGVYLEDVEAAAVASLSSIIKILTIISIIALVSIILLGIYLANTIANPIIKLSSHLKMEGDKIHVTAENLTNSSSALSLSIVEEASALQQTSSAIVEITSMVNQSTKTANDSKLFSAKSIDSVNIGNETIRDIEKAINNIGTSNQKMVESVEDSNKKITDIIKIIREIEERTNVINEIVFQTKLLSFNASVEAARAGEHGKGFAVVAEEIGNLAKMSGDAAKDIKEKLEISTSSVTAIINESKNNISNLISLNKDTISSANKVMEKFSDVFKTIMINTNKVNEYMEIIAVSTSEQSKGISEINIAMQRIDKSTNNNSTSAQNSLDIAKALLKQSQDLSKIVNGLLSIIYGKSA